MKKLFLLALPMALAAVSCSNEEVVSVNNDANEIKFTAVANNATRANTAETFCNYKLPGDFKVWAVAKKTADGGATTYPSYFEGVKYTQRSSDTWTADDQTNIHFWPNASGDALKFYAVRNYGELTTWTPAQNATLATTFTVNGTTDVDGNVGKQEDFIYAVSDYVTKADGKVTLNFRHALSQIVFKAKNTNNNLAVQITNVEIINLHNKAMCTLPSANTNNNYEEHTPSGTAPTDTCSWSGHTDFGADYSVKTVTCLMEGVTNDANLTNGKDNGKDDRDFSKAMLLIPQFVKPATINTTNKPTSIKNATDKGSMLAVTCKIWNLNTAGHLDQTTDVVLFNDVAYIPFPANWQPGKKYIYTLVFGQANGGYDEGGEPILVPITFNVTVDDFVTVTEPEVNVYK